MKILALSVAAFALLAGSASAHDAARKPHHKRIHHAQPQPAPHRDPYAAYWNDPGRQAPPFSYSGDVH